MVTSTVVGDIRLQWGESLRWDDARQRLYFVDCARQTLHWLDHGEPPLRSMQMPSLPTGVVLTDGAPVVVALDEGLCLVDVDAETVDLLAPYPEDLGGRANDAAADANGNLVTGTLNFGPGPGSYWWFSSAVGWQLLDTGIGNANGPVVLEDPASQAQTLVFADTIAAKVYAYPYDGERGTVGARRVLVDVAELGGAPDGACADADQGVWGCVLGAGQVVRYEADGSHHTAVDVGVELPSDVTFGGPDLDRMFVVSIAVSIGDIEISSPRAGALLAIDGVDHRGQAERRFHL
ncbi:MAG: SMP-30/gluconolactonase/LRE family protein [Actinobacteria bacterium]|nr:SMP-30/gluconolactonase/LRE family protein [Actinomycetota bacterium]